MATLMRATRLFAGVAALGLGGTCSVSAQVPASVNTSVSGPVIVRPEFTRPAGIPGSARTLATSEQYMLTPSQSLDPATPKKRKRR